MFSLADFNIDYCDSLIWMLDLQYRKVMSDWTITQSQLQGKSLGFVKHENSPNKYAR